MPPRATTELLDHAQEAGALVPALLHRAAHRLEVLEQAGAHGVHHVLGVALQQRHERLGALELRAPLIANRHEDQALVAHAIEERAQVGGVGQPQQAGGVDVERRRTAVRG